MKAYSYFFIILYIIFSCGGLLFLKMGGISGEPDISIMNINISYKTLAGILFYGCSFLLYILVISQTQISIMIPLLAAVNSCITVILGRIYFKEYMNRGQLIGIIVVIVGAAVLGYYSK